MATVKPQDIRNVAVVGHKGSGKTSLIEAMLMLAGVVPRLGKPGAWASSLDDSPEEKAHLATLEVRPATFTWAGKKLNVLDTPGEASFVTETNLALAVAEAAVLVISAKHGVETGTERLARTIRDRKIPALIVLTKLDDPDARIDEVLADLKLLKLPYALMQLPHQNGGSFDGVISVATKKAWLGKGEAPNAKPVEAPADVAAELDKARGKLVDDVASSDDALTEKYLSEGDLSERDLEEGIHRAVAQGKLVPVFFTSSNRPAGIFSLLDAIVELVPNPTERGPWKGVEGQGEATRPPIADAPATAVIFKTHVDPHAGRLSCARVLSGTLTSDLHLTVATKHLKERAAQLLQGVGREVKPLMQAVAGDIVWIAKLKAAATGDTLSDEKHAFTLELPPKPMTLYSRTVKVESKQAEEKVAQALVRLCDEDPGLSYTHAEEGSRDIILNGMGTVHLDIALERLKHRTGLTDIKLGPPRIPYRETFTRPVKHVEGKHKKQTGGHGQFGVCYIDVEPLPRGSGFVFEDAIVGGAIPRQFIPSVEKGIHKVLAKGVLAGYPIVDIKVRLVDGKYHSVDSSDAAFQMAGYKGIKAAAAQAHPILLEPVVKLEVLAPGEAMGDIIGDISSRGGRVLGTEQEGETTLITAHVPLSQVLEYEPALTAMTRGRGRFTFHFDHYAPCSPAVQEKVVKESGFKPIEEEE